MKKLASLEITKEERAEFETKLNTIKGKLNQEDLQWAIQHANAPEGERRMPHCMMKAKKVLKQLILEPSISPDERKCLEEKLTELKAKMSPELISALDSKVIEFKEKLAKREKKRNEKLKEKIASVIQDQAVDIAEMITNTDDKKKSSNNLLIAFSRAFSALPEEKQTEIDIMLKGVPRRIVETNEYKRVKALQKANRSESKNKSRSKSPKKDKKKWRKESKERKFERALTPKVEAPKSEDVKYLPFVEQKAQALKEIFQDANLQALKEFVNANSSLSVDELAESYLAARPKEMTKLFDEKQ